MTAHAVDAPIGVRARRPARALRWVGPLLVLAVLALALAALRAELAGHGYPAVARAVRALPPARLGLAVALTAVAYAVLAGYDALALAYVGRTGAARPPLRRVVGGAFVAYGVSQSLGFPAVTGAAVRYRLWSGWGLSAPEIARAASFAGATFGLGVALVTGLALVAEPAPLLAPLHLAAWPARLLGGALLALVAVVLAWSAARGGRTVRLPARLGGWELRVPRPRLVLAQAAVALLDWGLAAGVLYVLLPRGAGIGPAGFAGLFVLAQCAGLLSHVPGGVGVFETAMVLLLRGALPADRVLAALLAALLAYRAVYYLLPLALALGMLAALEARRQRAWLHGAMAATVGTLRGAGSAFVPTALSVAVFAAGALLLWSGATPSVRPRVAALHAVLPLAVIEASHLLGSVAGTALLILGWALHRRLDAAYRLTLVALALGAAASLLKGLDWEESLVLAGVAATVLPYRRAFYRRAALTAEVLEPGWVAAVVAVVGASVWLGLFSFQHVEYARDLWWRFRPHADAPRFLRATVVSCALLVAFGLRRLLRCADAEVAAPDATTLGRAAHVVARAPDADAALALTGDKALLFAGAPGAEGFVQFGVAGRSWIAMGDPVVPAGDAAPALRTALVWRFREEADRHGGWPVFYQVRGEHLPLYVDLGLTFLKLGEEGRVPLAGFTLDGGHRKWLRRVVKECERAGVTFAVVDAAHVPALLPELRAVSDAWLAHKRVREKGFSLGFFDADYLARGPVAVARAASPDGGPGRVVAFANLWTGAAREELSVDLMRFTDDAPRNVMDYLFAQLMRWGSAEGYRWFNLGMAPLSGLEQRQLAPLWTRAGAWLFRHGEHFYNFRGLRQYKEKYDPEWTPRYLASPGGLALPRILANVTTLIAGGVTGLVSR